MKRLVVVFTILLVLGRIALAAEGCRVGAAHFDVRGGPLTLSMDDGSPLPDGCSGQIIVDILGDGIAPPRTDGAPGDGDALLALTLKGMKQSSGVFLINGSAALGAQGFFISPDFIGDDIPAQPVFLRVWNSPDPRTVSGYWDSPPCRLTFGPQQISFPRSAWTFHPFTPSVGAAPGDKNLSAESTLGQAQSHDLLQTFPNPFNSTARITFSLSQAGHARLVLFDVQGRQVRTLLDATLPAGPHALTLDGRALPSGLYFASLQTPHSSPVVRRVLLVR